MTKDKTLNHNTNQIIENKNIKLTAAERQRFVMEAKLQAELNKFNPDRQNIVNDSTNDELIEIHNNRVRLIKEHKARFQKVEEKKKDAAPLVDDVKDENVEFEQILNEENLLENKEDAEEIKPLVLPAARGDEIASASASIAKAQKKEKPKSKARLKYEEIMVNLRNPVRKAVRTQRISNTLTSILRAAIIIGLSFVIVFPIFQQITLAFRHPSDVQNPLVIWIPEKWSVLNFQIAFRLLDYNISLWNNVKVSFVCMIGQIFCSVLAGYTFARLKFKGSNILFIILLMTFIIPPQAVSVSRMLYFAHFDILGIIKLFNHGNAISLSGKRIILYIMSFTGQGINSAIFIFLFRQFFRGVPVELEESAEIDGAGVVRTFWSVMLPNARGVMITVALFSFVWQWNDVYYTSLLAISTSDFPMLTMRLKNTAEWLPSLMKLYRLESLVDAEIRGNALFTSLIANTAGFMMCLPLLIGYLFVQRLFVEGIERTGIVG